MEYFKIFDPKRERKKEVHRRGRINENQTQMCLGPHRTVYGD